MRSEVDENLFGPPNRIKQAQQMRENKSSRSLASAWPFPSSCFVNGNFVLESNYGARASGEDNLSSPERNRRNGPQHKEYIKHITKDLIRDIL